MAMTIVETRAITGGVDTHADVHVAVALDPIGGLLGVKEFPPTAAGYGRLMSWLGGFGTVALVGIEGTGSYGAGLARYVTAAGVRVVEVDRSDRQDRRSWLGGTLGEAADRPIFDSASDLRHSRPRRASSPSSALGAELNCR
jgi:transposase